MVGTDDGVGVILDSDCSSDDENGDNGTAGIDEDGESEQTEIDGKKGGSDQMESWNFRLRNRGLLKKPERY